METIKITSDRTASVRFHGRTAERDGGVYLPWSASGFTVRFCGTALRATLAANNTNVEDGRPYVRVFVDGEQREKIGLYEPQSDVLLTEGLSEGEHTVTVLKCSEARRSHVVLQALTTDGAFLAPPPCETTRRIQFIGDSITTGFGVLAPEEQSPFTTAEQDALEGYAWRTATALGAEAHLFAISGYAVYRSPFGDPIMQHYPFVDGAAEDTILWDYDRFQPDITVINLGTNDHAWLHNPIAEHIAVEERHRLIEEAYYNLLQQVRSMHPHSKFLCVIGMMYAFVDEDIERAVARAAAEGMDVRFERLPLAKQFRAGHADLECHRTAAAILTPLIADWMGWE